MAREVRLRLSERDYEVVNRMADDRYVDVNTLVRILIRQEAKKEGVDIPADKGNVQHTDECKS
jgi:hypothetical protein